MVYLGEKIQISYWGHRKPVGASLLAIAACQATSILDVPTSSRAGSLPQFFSAERR
jgi:hypothetical protein